MKGAAKLFEAFIVDLSEELKRQVHGLGPYPAHRFKTPVKALLYCAERFLDLRWYPYGYEGPYFRPPSVFMPAASASILRAA